MYSVYKHTAPNGKVYIGMTRQKPQNRWLYGYGYQTQQRFYRAIQKYGWNAFSHEILYENLTHKEAEEKERELISQYRSFDPKCGYNVEKGGNCAKVVSDETREKLRLANLTPQAVKRLREFNDKRWSDPKAHLEMSKRFSGKNNPMYGKKMSEAHKRALIEGSRNAVRIPRTGEKNSMFGKHHSESAKSKISKANTGGNNGRAKKVLCIETKRVYDSVKDAFRDTGIHFSSIAKCCTGVIRSAGRLHWQYADEMEV